jgi:hypothetical protein
LLSNGYARMIGVMCRKCFKHAWVRIENGFVRDIGKA